MSSEIFPADFFRALEGLSRRRPTGRTGSATLARAGQSRPGFEHRPYQPLDEIRRLDWRATARRGIPQVRRDELESGGEWLLILDRSPSLTPRHARRDLDQRRLALALGWLALESGGRLSLAAGPGPLRRYSGWERRGALQKDLEDLPLAGERETGFSQEIQGRGAHRRVLALGDPWVQSDWWQALHACAHAGDQVSFVVMILPEEDRPPAEGLRLRSAEDGEEYTADLSGGRFAGCWNAFLERVKSRGRAAGVRMVEIRCGQNQTPATAILHAAEEAGLV